MSKIFKPEPYERLFPLGQHKLVTQIELYSALTDFDGRREVAESTEPVLAASQSIRHALGVHHLSSAQKH